MGRVRNEPPLVKYATASDGTNLRWMTGTPSGWVMGGPSVLLIHGGGWKAGDPWTPYRVCSPALLAAGYKCYSIEYRLAPPGELPGQVSMGRYPDQTDDVAKALAAALLESDVVAAVGGSAGGYHSAMLQALRMVRVAVIMSPATNLLEHGSSGFEFDVQNYAAGHEEEASPIVYLNSASSPVMLIAFERDQMPANQYDDYRATLIEKNVPHSAILMPGSGHSFDAWPKSNANGVISDQAVAFINQFK